MGLGLLPATGLSAESDAQQRALEVLRRTMAEQDQGMPMVNPPPLQSDPRAQQRALEVLRRTETQPAAPQPLRRPEPPERAPQPPRPIEIQNSDRQPATQAIPPDSSREVAEAQQRALEVLRRTMAEGQAVPPPRTRVEVPPEVSETLRRTEPGPTRTLLPPVGAPAVRPAPMDGVSSPPAVDAAGVAAPEYQPAPVDTKAQQQALQLLRRTIAEQDREERALRGPPPARIPAPVEPPRRAERPIAPAPVPPAVREPAPAPPVAPAPEPPSAIEPPDEGPSEVEAPAPPQTKAQKLRALLERYRADEIGPAEYHAERARILAEP
jgi:hypothetical protein